MPPTMAFVQETKISADIISLLAESGLINHIVSGFSSLSSVEMKKKSEILKGPIGPFKILEPQNPRISKLYVAWNSQSMDFTIQ